MSAARGWSAHSVRPWRASASRSRALTILRVAGSVLIVGVLIAGCQPRGSTDAIGATHGSGGGVTGSHGGSTATPGTEDPASGNGQPGDGQPGNGNGNGNGNGQPGNGQPGDPPPGGGCASYPTADCTGVPAGTKLNVHQGDLSVSKAGEVVDGLHVTGALLIRASGVVIRNSQIDGVVNNESLPNPFYSFTISDSTIGSTSRCDSTGSALGEANFTATRVNIRGFGDGIRASDSNVTVRDSYIKLCTTSGDSHSDGIQDYPKTGNLVFDHNTVDQCGPRFPASGKCDLGGGFTAPIFVHSSTDGGTNGAVITDNLVMGGVYSLLLRPEPGKPWVVTGNRVVNGTWAYGPLETEGQCSRVQKWSDNTVVTIDAAYRVTSTLRTVGCPG